MNLLPKNAEYFSVTRRIRFGFGVSGNDNVSKGCVGKILERQGDTNHMSVYLAGLGERRINTPDIEAINEKEYFMGMLKG